MRTLELSTVDQGQAPGKPVGEGKHVELDDVAASVGLMALAAVAPKTSTETPLKTPGTFFHRPKWCRTPLALPDVSSATALTPVAIDALFPGRPSDLAKTREAQDAYEKTHFIEHPVCRPASIKDRGDRLVVTCGIRRPPRPSQEVIAHGLAFHSRAYSPMLYWCRESRSFHPDLYPTHVAPFVPLDETTTSIDWARETFARLCALRARSTAPERYVLEGMADPVMRLAPRLTNTTPEELIPQREIVMDGTKREFYGKIMAVFGDQCSPEMVWFLLENSAYLTPDMLEHEAVNGPLEKMGTCLENGLVVDRLHELFQKACTKGLAPLQALAFSLRVVGAIYGGKNNYVYNGWNYGHEAWWFKENMDLTVCFDEGVNESGECGGRFCLAWDEKGMGIVAELAEVAQVAFEPTLALYKAGGYRIERFATPSLQERYKCLSEIVRWYGIWDLPRALRVFEFMEGVMEDAPGDRAEKVFYDFHYYLREQRPENPLVGCLEGDNATIYIPGISGIEFARKGEDPKAREKNPVKTDPVADNSMTAGALRAYFKTLTRSSSCTDLVLPSFPPLPKEIPPDRLLVFPDQDVVLSPASPKFLPRLTPKEAPLRGLAGLFSFYKPHLRDSYSTETLPVEVFHSYWRYFAQEMPDPFSPPTILFDRWAKDGRAHERDSFITFLQNLVTHVKVDWCAYVPPPSPSSSYGKSPEPLWVIPKMLETLQGLLQLWTAGFLDERKLCSILPTLVEEGKLPPWEGRRWDSYWHRDVEMHPYKNNDPRPLLQKRYEAIGTASEVLMSQRVLVDLGFLTEAQWLSLGKLTLLHGEKNCRITDFIPQGETAESLAPWLRLLVHEGFLDCSSDLLGKKWFLSNLWTEAARFKQALTFLKKLEGETMKNLLGGGCWDGPEQIGGITMSHYDDFHRFVGLADGWHGLVLDRQCLEYIFYAYSPLFTIVNLLCEQHSFPLTRQALRSALGEIPTLSSPRSPQRPLLGVDSSASLALRQKKGGGAIAVHSGVHLENLLVRLAEHHGKGGTPQGSYARLAPDLVGESKGMKGIRRMILAGWEEDIPQQCPKSDAPGYIVTVARRLEGMMTAVLAIKHVAQFGAVPPDQLGVPRDSLQEITAMARDQLICTPSPIVRTRSRRLLKALRGFYEKHPGLKEEIREARLEAFGLVPIGAKIHFNKPVDGWVIDMVIKTFGLQNSSFKMERANKCLILFAVPSAGELELLLRCLGSFGLWDDHSSVEITEAQFPELQIGHPGRLSQRDAGIWASTLLLSTEIAVPFTAASFRTSHDETGAHLVACEARGGYSPAPLFFMPPPDLVEGVKIMRRMDVLCRRAISDARRSQAIFTGLAMDSLGFGALREFWPIEGEGLSTQFVRDHAALLSRTPFREGVSIQEGGSLLRVLEAQWYYRNPGKESRDDRVNQAHFDDAVGPCVEAYFANERRWKETGREEGVIFDMRRCYETYRHGVRLAQMALLSSGRAGHEAEVLLNF